MQNALKFYIDGEWVDPITPKTLDVINPATEQSIGQISLGGAADVDRAVAAAKRAFESYGRTSREERISYLERILAVYKHRWEDLAQAMSMEMGAPLKFASSSQARAGFSHLSSALDALRSFEFEQKLGDSPQIAESGQNRTLRFAVIAA